MTFRMLEGYVVVLAPQFWQNLSPGSSSAPQLLQGNVGAAGGGTMPRVGAAGGGEIGGGV